MIENFTFRVAAIDSGTVIDHIVAGMAIQILPFLKLESHKRTVMVGIHLPSTRMGVKDLIKIEGMHLNARQQEIVALFSPNATINRIENSKVVLKSSLNPLKYIEGIMTCQTSRCVTNHENIEGKFSVNYRGNKLLLKCCYCEKILY